MGVRRQRGVPRLELQWKERMRWMARPLLQSVSAKQMENCLTDIESQVYSLVASHATLSL